MADGQDSKLDLTSPNFDPSLALAAVKIDLPVENAEAFDSITEYFNIIEKKPESSSQEPKQLTNKEIKEERRKRLLAMTQRVEKKEEENEDKIRPRSQRHLRSVITYMENSCKIGPLGLLYKCMNERIKIKVWTRNYKFIRGICTGFVSAYDKHWNLALSDVDESFVVYSKRKSPATGEEECEISRISEMKEERGLGNDQRRKGVKLSQSVPYLNALCVESNRKMQTCQRHVNQLFIRGENIVIIAVSSS